MVFDNTKKKIRSQVILTIERLRPSKASLGSSTSKAEVSYQTFIDCLNLLISSARLMKFLWMMLDDQLSTFLRLIHFLDVCHAARSPSRDITSCRIVSHGHR